MRVRGARCSKRFGRSGGVDAGDVIAQACSGCCPRWTRQFGSWVVDEPVAQSPPVAGAGRQPRAGQGVLVTARSYCASCAVAAQR